MGLETRQRLFQNVVRLRRAERELPGNRDIGMVRMDLEQELGETVSRAFAARLLGVSHTALGRWIDRAEVPVVIAPGGRSAVPVSALVDLYEAVARERAAGRGHPLEAAVGKERERAARLNPESLIGGKREGGDPHLDAERRSLAYHRAVARRLRRSTADDALVRVRRWRRAGRIDPRYADSWEEILARPLPGIRKVLEGEDQLSRDLRQNSPFAGLLSEAERRKIVGEIR